MIASQSERAGGSKSPWSVRQIGSLVKVLFSEVCGREMKLGISSWERAAEVGGGA